MVNNDYYKGHQFVTVLDDYFQEKRRRNGSYSLRAFAKTLDDDASYLSKILKGKRRITAAKIVKFAKALKLSEEETNYFVKQAAKNQKPQKDFTAKIDEQEMVQAAVINYTPTWFHFVLPKLIKTKGFQSNLKWIANKLNLSEAKTAEIVNQLVDGKFITKTQDGYKALGHYVYTMTQADNSSAKVVFKKIMTQSLKMALKSFEDMEANWDTMAHSSSFVNGYIDNIPLARKKIVEFRRELIAILEKQPEGADKNPELLLNIYYGFNEIKSFKTYEPEML